MVRGNKFKPGEQPLKKRKLQEAGDVRAPPGLGHTEHTTVSRGLPNGHSTAVNAHEQPPSVHAQQGASQDKGSKRKLEKSVQLGVQQRVIQKPGQGVAQQKQIHAGWTANQRKKARKRALKLAQAAAHGQAASDKPEQANEVQMGPYHNAEPCTAGQPHRGKVEQMRERDMEQYRQDGNAAAAQHAQRKKRVNRVVAGSSQLRETNVEMGGGKTASKKPATFQAGDDPAFSRPQGGSTRPVQLQTILAPPQRGTAGASNWEALKAVIGAGQGKSYNSRLKGTLPSAASDAKRPEPLSARAGATQILAVDCEMVGVGPDGVRSSLARVCIVNDQGNVLLDKHVLQKEKVTDYRTRWSGIRPANLRPSVAEPFEAVQREAAALFDGRILVGHAIVNDLKALLLSHPKKMIRDTARYPPLMRSTAPGRKPKPRALRHLAFEVLGLGIQEGEHSPVDDARAALYLYQRHRIEWEQSIFKGTFKNLKAPTPLTKEKGRHTGKSLADLAAKDDMVDL